MSKMRGASGPHGRQAERRHNEGAVLRIGRRLFVLSMLGVLSGIVLFATPKGLAGLTHVGDSAVRRASDAVTASQADVRRAPLEPAVSNKVEREVADELQTAVPEMTELYIEPERGGYALLATASVSGYRDTRVLTQDIASRYLTAAYNQVRGQLPVIFASLYVEEDGRYVLASGLGLDEANQLAIQTFAPDEGHALAEQLSRVDDYTGAQIDQGFSEYKGI
ncbi:MAG: hypothetical protein OWT28_08975 [Firmicutes bacterium]|nr:hypothetical protein [Bacillota bacterium]